MLTIPSIVVHPPQDEIPSFKQTPVQLNNALDLATVRVPRELEAAIGAVSEMKAIVGAGHIASEINNANNPITQVSLLLNTLSKFNDVVTNIATV